MAYDSTYAAVEELYDRDDGWDALVNEGDRTCLNLGKEALGRHGNSQRTGLRVRDFETKTTETYTFATLDSAANRVANYLTEHTERGDRVGAMLPAGLDLYAVVFGTLKAGRIYVPLAPIFGPDALNYRLADSNTALLFTTGNGLSAVDSSAVPSLERIVLSGSDRDKTGVDGPAIESFAAIDDCHSAFDAVETHSSDVFTITYTSATTGQPKGATATHGATIDLHSFVRHVVDLLPDDVYFVAASSTWSYGLQMGTIMAGLVGTGIGYYRGPFDPTEFFGTLDELGVTNAMVPPTALRQARAVGVDLDEFDIDLRVLVSAGEPLMPKRSRGVKRAWERHSSTMTETRSDRVRSERSVSSARPTPVVATGVCRKPA